MYPEDFKKAREALENLDDLARMLNVIAGGAYNVLSKFIDDAEELQRFVDDAMQFHSNLDLDVEYIRKNTHAD